LKNLKKYGNQELPIFEFKGEILNAVAENDCVIITAETGAGKSTQVPQYLLEAGYQTVVTEPRRLAARTVSERVAEEYGCEFGDLVGCRTGESRNDSSATRCLFCTDGLQLVRELTGAGADVLVLDEVHEWNINIETLVAWARKRLADFDNFKVIIMSATLQADKLNFFFTSANIITSHIHVPGRQHPVEMKEETYSEISTEVKSLVKDGRNVLVFQPGKAEIAKTIEELSGLEAQVLPLHGELRPEEQKKCFQHYNVPKVVVSTNVAQTSVTIDDIDAVVDSGIERRVELVDGIEGLYLKPVSQADCKQRAGRAGRTKEGVYVLCSSTSLDSRPAFPKAEIERSRLDQLVLRLAVAGFDATELEFFHQPDRQVLTDAKKALSRLGALDQDGNVTETGKLMSKLPVDVHIARMVVEGAKRGVVEDVIDIAACMEAGGIKDRSGNALSLVSEGNFHSDLLAELEIFHKAQKQKMNKKDLREAGIFIKSYYRAKEIRRKLRRALRRHVRIYSTGDGDKDKEQILKSCVAGMIDHLFEHHSDRRYRNGSNGSNSYREMNNKSVVYLKNDTMPEWITGLPFDLEVPSRGGGRVTLHLIEWISSVDPQCLVEIAPQLYSAQLGQYSFDAEAQSVVQEHINFFNGAEISRENLPVQTSSSESAKVFAQALADGWVENTEVLVEANEKVREKSEILRTRSGGEFEKILKKDEVALYQLHFEKAKVFSAASFAQAIKNGLKPQDLLLKLEDYISVEEQEKIRAQNPDHVEIAGREFEVDYSHDPYSTPVFLACVEVEKDFAYQVRDEVDNVKLPSGRSVYIRCQGLRAQNFSDLIDKLEKERLEKSWDKARDEEFSVDPDQLEDRAHDIYKKIKVDVDMDHEMIYGYLGLVTSWSGIRFQLFKDLDEAKRFTGQTLASLLDSQIHAIVEVPQEASFQEQTSGYWSSRWELTEVGRELEDRFFQMRKSILAEVESLDLTDPRNYFDQVERIKQKVKAEFGGQYAELKQKIAEVEKEVEGQYSS